MISAIVLAAGSGKRMNTQTAKQFLKIYDKEVLYYSLKVFEDSALVDNIILVTKEEDIEYCRTEILGKYKFTKIMNIISGGRERYDSVRAGLSLLKCKINEGMITRVSDVEDSNVGDISRTDNIVLIHDGARPFITESMISESVATAKKYGACSVGVPVKDTIKIIDENGFSVGTPNRNFLYQIQTPQTFMLDLILDAYDKFEKDNNHNITDDTMLIEQYTGVNSKIIFGSYENIKITTPDDMEIAEMLVKKNFKKI